MPRKAATKTPAAPKPKPKTKATPPAVRPAPHGHIRIQGARVNNLKNISCDLPLEQFIVVTGPSGSGKSSLAFDTLFAEGQRRYIESMSSYARQFLARIEKPDVDAIDHILPAIALEQKNSIKNARSTVGTATEIYDYLRILFAHLGQVRCLACGGTVKKRDAQTIVQAILKQHGDGDKLLLIAPVSALHVSPETLVRQGFIRQWQAGEVTDIQPDDTLSDAGTLAVVADRLIVRHTEAFEARLLEAVGQAMDLSTRFGAGDTNGDIQVVPPDQPEALTTYTTRFACMECGASYAEPTPDLFSFNSPLGACPTCEGYGRIIGLDLGKVIPNSDLSLKEGAIHPFTMPSNQELQQEMLRLCKKEDIPTDRPYSTLTTQQKALILNGRDYFMGVHGLFNYLESKKYKVHVRVMLAKYRGYYDCPDCAGSRLRPEALAVSLRGHSIDSLCRLSIADLRDWFAGIAWTPAEEKLAARMVEAVTDRLNTLAAMGLVYLTLSRQSRTLSGGEAQRINLSAALGCGLTDTLYVLDEPTVGLHARDTDRLIGTLQSLRSRGNTVLVVEHDPEVMLAADHLIDLGPGGGAEGGRILYEGAPAGLLKAPLSPTAQALRHRGDAAAPQALRQRKLPVSGSHTPIDILGASGHNLKRIAVSLPAGRLVCITGVSGSGKSSLIKGTLLANHEHKQGRSLQMDALPCQSIKGLEQFEDLIFIDQTPPGRSVRSNPATYVKAWDDIRTLFAAQRKAMVLGITASHFSFNAPGGRCETCEGLGTLTIDMQFMADVTVTCHDCQGRRFNPNVLQVDVDGKTIVDILRMTVDDAITFFARHAQAVVRKLQPLQQIGLGYLQLGQSTDTLSGGEAQRLKLALYLKAAIAAEEATENKKKNRKATPKYLFLFDEPTTGLHLTDIDRLVVALRQVLSAGHSVVVIEHNLDFVAHADWVIDLGPEGGAGGGHVVAEGTVADIIANPASVTGRYLKKAMQG
ncbi:MAG: excinuclease ABC subunit UvrA [Candidatus Melainabacteria bacterium]